MSLASTSRACRLFSPGFKSQPRHFLALGLQAGSSSPSTIFSSMDRKQ